MAEYTANALQSVAVGGNVIFTDTADDSCACVTHRDGSGIFTLHGNKKYLLVFSANVTGATAGTEVDLAVTIAGEEVATTKMASTPAVADDLNNVSTAIFLTVPSCCCYTVAIENVGTTAITVQNANLIVTREA